MESEHKYFSHRIKLWHVEEGGNLVVVILMIAVPVPMSVVILIGEKQK